MKTAALVLLAPIVHACGVAVHLELAERIIALLPPRLAEQKDFVRSGAFYPDAFYDCGGQYDVAEDAHWPPFLAKSVELVHKRRSEGQDTAQLEAFLVGILTHQVSDVSWHSLSIFQGLLEAMSASEFDDDYGSAHTNLDIGGDMVQLSRRSIRQRKSADWAYNVDDIRELVQNIGYHDISDSAIRFCMARGHVAYKAELSVADVGFRRFARRSPLMFDELETYFTGGLTDMHEQIEECLPVLRTWLDSGVTEEDPLDMCPVFLGHKRDEQEGHYHHGIHQFPDYIDHETLKKSLELEDEATSLVKKSFGMYGSDGVVMEFFAKVFPTGFMDFMVELMHDVKWEASGKFGFNQDHTTEALACEVIVAPQADTTSLEQSGDVNNDTPMTVAFQTLPHFGESLIFWDDDLAAGASAEGKIYIYDGIKDIKQVLTSPYVPKQWGKLATRYGTALAVWQDIYLVVSSPGISHLDIYDRAGEWVGGVQWSNTSTVYGQMGHKLVGDQLITDDRTNTLYVSASRTDNNLTVEQVGLVYGLPGSMLNDALKQGEIQEYLELEYDDNVVVNGNESYQRVGTSLALSSEHLLVGSPGTEEVFAFDRDTHELKITLRSQALNKRRPSGFGGHFLGAQGDHILVGAPAGSITDKTNTDNQQGVLTIYSNEDKRMIGGVDEFEWFGDNGIIIENTAYTVSPYASQGRGMMWMVDLDTNVMTKLGMPDLSFASGFGSAMATNGKVLAVGMPNYGQDQATYHATHKRLGAVAIIPIL